MLEREMNAQLNFFKSVVRSFSPWTVRCYIVLEVMFLGTFKKYIPEYICMSVLAMPRVWHELSQHRTLGQLTLLPVNWVVMLLARRASQRGRSVKAFVCGVGLEKTGYRPCSYSSSCFTYEKYKLEPKRGEMAKQSISASQNMCLSPCTES